MTASSRMPRPQIQEVGHLLAGTLAVPEGITNRPPTSCSSTSLIRPSLESRDGGPAGSANHTRHAVRVYGGLARSRDKLVEPSW